MDPTPDPIAAGLATIRRRRRISGVIFLCMPVMYLGALVAPMLGFAIGAVWFVAALVSSVIASSSVCPRCGLSWYYNVRGRRRPGGPFFNRKALTWRNIRLTILGLHCVNCGLLLREGSPATEQTHTPTPGV